MKKCHFCRKKLKREYTVKKKNLTYSVCSECEYIHKIIYNQRAAKRYTIMYKIFKFLETSETIYGKHCTTCRNYLDYNSSYCRRDLWTGIGDRHASMYPRSFALHGCDHYREV